jgi:1-acyl-sn-glycerol-3-phosphate acyltransferase
VSSSQITILAIFAGLALLSIPLVVIPYLRSGPAGSMGVTFFWATIGFYLGVVHRARYFGREKLPRSNADLPLIVVSNHTGGVDPLLIQCGVRFKIHWMMAADYMVGPLGWFWRLLEIIPVERTGRDSGPAREAIRRVRAGKVVGIFPEGGIVRPPGEIRAFLSGAGLIITKTKAPVLLVWVHGTTPSESTFGSLLRPSKARVHYLGIFDFSSENDPRALTERLRCMLAEASGWPLNDEPVATARKNATGT